MATTQTPNLLGDQLFQARLKANDFVQEHMKTIVTVASGTLVLTVSFVKDVVGSGPEPEHAAWLLALSWCTLGLAVFSATFGMATLINNLDDADTSTDRTGIPKAFAAGKKGIVLRWELVSICLFGVGILALAVFGAANYRLFLQRRSATETPHTAQLGDKEGLRHFSIVSTPDSRQDGLGTVHSHSFLLDESTGELWQMVCSKGGFVTFRKIAVEGIPRPTVSAK
jgi:hypothetical protein